MRRYRVQEALAVMSLLAVLVGLPLAIWHYEAVRRPAALAPGNAQVVRLTGLGEGIWTTERVTGLNYWWREFEPASHLTIDPSRPLVLRVHSADVLHSIGIPALRRRPVDVFPGTELVIRIETADLEGQTDLAVQCWQVCGPSHAQMIGHLIPLPQPAANTSR